MAKVLNVSCQRCHVDFMRNVLAHAGKSGHRVVSAFIATARPRGRNGARSPISRPKLPKLAGFLNGAEPRSLLT
ncbi:hypothetical protein ABIB06_000256 [Bradyrhizobium sp. LB8.2]